MILAKGIVTLFLAISQDLASPFSSVSVSVSLFLSSFLFSFIQEPFIVPRILFCCLHVTHSFSPSRSQLQHNSWAAPTVNTLGHHCLEMAVRVLCMNCEPRRTGLLGCFSSDRVGAQRSKTNRVPALTGLGSNWGD